jgi:hypothetical protein
MAGSSSAGSETAMAPKIAMHFISHVPPTRLACHRTRDIPMTEPPQP